MVERGREPAVGSMASAAIHAKTPSVLIILCMAGVAVLRRELEVRNVAGIDMALRTQHLGMFPD